ncbi:MAG: NAD(P)/FAD-dependent oxidoreductase [Nitrososphaerales archaeon]
MKFAIVGAGVAGSFMASMLTQKDHEVQVFELYRKEQHFPVCAWGASRHMLSHFSQMAGLDFNDYILHVGERIGIRLPNGKSDYLNCLGLVTYDKKRWEDDLLDGIPVNYGVRCTLENFPLHKYDYVLDCTGFHRSLLPRPKEKELIIPAWEYLVDNVYGANEFYILGYKGATGYFWFFPLKDNRAYVGAGDMNRIYLGVEEFFKENPTAKIVTKIGRPIRITPPTRMEPLTNGNVIGVGESIGCVFPLLGEGIIPSLICSETLFDLFANKEYRHEEYRKRLLKKLGYYDEVYKVISLKMEGKLSTIKHFKILYKLYRNMKREEKRFGFEVNMEKLVNLLNAL